jgi:Sugar-transfer associated ATP-grasp
MSRIGNLKSYSALVKQLTGKSYAQQCREIFRLARGPLRLGIEEYYEFEVFDDKYFSPERKSDCVGWRASTEIDKRLNHSYWRATANDKVLNYALLQQYGFEIPQTIATFSVKKRRIGAELSLASREELEDFLTNSMTFPVFIKPIHGSYGRGTFLLESYDPSRKSFVDVHSKHVAMVDLLSECVRPQYSGMLFQRPLQPHDDVKQWTGSATSCVRVIVAMTANSPKVHMAFWKIARAHNITDNFHMGSTGNLLAALDKHTGRIERVVTGLWPGGKSVTHHPDTQQELCGKTLPDWEEAMAMCLSAATCFPGLRLQHWDVAFCRQGPVLMELNTEADLGVPQFLARIPFMDPLIHQMMEGK